MCEECITKALYQHILDVLFWPDAELQATLITLVQTLTTHSRQASRHFEPCYATGTIVGAILRLYTSLANVLMVREEMVRGIMLTRERVHLVSHNLL